MLMFFFGFVILISGYFLYGRIVERIIGPTDNPTPAIADADGVDFMVLPHWKNMLIQLLNIAGVGPVIGVILGIKFGPIVFILLPIGNILGGAVHDYVAGMMSMRHHGATLPEVVRRYLGKGYYVFFSVFMCLLLLLVVTVFINVPAQLVDSAFPSVSIFWVTVAVVFVYYIVATLFSIDKIIGLIYPYFGAVLIIASFAILGSVVWHDIGAEQDLLLPWDTFVFNQAPIVPVLFVTIACGIISGFHATQAPIVARTMKSERQGRQVFYGMMVLEGVIGMIWAAVGMAIYNLVPELLAANPNTVLAQATTYFLGDWLGGLTVFSVIVLTVTSGDTALRSLRLSIAEIIHFDQKSFPKRIMIVIPLILIIMGLLAWSSRDVASFNHLWNYFAWGNQVLAASTLMAGTVYLMSQKKVSFITLLPGCFMTFIVVAYIMWVDTDKFGGPNGLDFDMAPAYLTAGYFTVIFAAYTLYRGYLVRKENAQKHHLLNK